MDQAGNIVLIGMPGVGKSTVGVLLAKALSRQFLDTDVHIQAREGCTLQRLIDTRGLSAFCELEQRHILGLDVSGTVIATGGSVVYSAAAMEHLGRGGRIVHLRLDLPRLSRRITNQATRGIVIEPGQSLEGLYRQRRALYEQYAQLSLDCQDLTQDQVVERLLTILG